MGSLLCPEGAHPSIYKKNKPKQNKTQKTKTKKPTTNNKKLVTTLKLVIYTLWFCLAMFEQQQMNIWAQLDNLLLQLFKGSIKETKMMCKFPLQILL